MTDHPDDQDRADREAATDQAAAEAVALVAASYLAETRGRRLNRRLRDQQDRAARLASYMSRQAAKEGRP